MTRPFARRSRGPLAVAVAFFLSLSLSALSTAPAAAAAPAPQSSVEKPYNVIAHHSGRCLESTNVIPHAGQKIVQGDCEGDRQERWHLRASVLGSGAFQIVLQEPSPITTDYEFCMGIPDLSVVNPQLELVNCRTGANAHFRMYEAGAEAQLRLVGATSAKCVAVRNGSHVPGAPVLVGDCTAAKPGMLIGSRIAAVGNAPAGNGFGGIERVNLGPGDVQTVAKPKELGEKSDSNSVSPDGRYVAFEAKGPGLVAADVDNLWDVFVRDLATGTTEEVSVTTSTGEQANGYSSEPSISKNGDTVAFRSKATNLVDRTQPANANAPYNVFVHKRASGVTHLISQTTGGQPGVGHSASPSVSADGRYVAFDSTDPNLVTGDTNNAMDAFVRDTVDGTTIRVSTGVAGAQADKDSGTPTITPDGRHVVFLSRATNLVSGTTHSGATYDIYVRDLQTNTTRRVSKSLTGNRANGASGDPSISDDGSRVVFQSDASDMLPATEDTNDLTDIYVWERADDSIRRISVNHDGVERQRHSAVEPSMSADGKFVSFTSAADRIVKSDLNDAADVFVKELKKLTDLNTPEDRRDNPALRVSVNGQGVESNATSEYANLSGSGEQLLFHSDSTRLVDGDTNNARDIFTRPRPRP